MGRMLLGMGLVMLVAGAVGAAPVVEHEYVGAKKCRTCHKKELIGNQYGEWQESKHAKAFETLKEQKAIDAAREKGLTKPPHEAKECLKCHVTAYEADAKFVPKPLDAEMGVQCESCHGPGKDYRKKKIMADRDKASAQGLWDPGKDETICTGCHNDESPSWDPEKYELADGSKVGFDFEQAKEKIAHPIPEDVKGKYIEMEKKLRAEKRARGEADDDEEEEEDDD